MTQLAHRVYHNFAEFERSEHRGVGAAATMTALTPSVMSIDQMLDLAFPSTMAEEVPLPPSERALPDNLIELFEVRGPVRFGSVW